MRGLSYLKVVGIALGFVSGTQSSGVASTLPRGEWGEQFRDYDHAPVQLRDDDDHFRLRSSNSKSIEPHELSIETAIVASLLDGSRPPSNEEGIRPGGGFLEGIRFDVDDGPTQGVSATPLPAAFPLFAGGLGVLG